MKFLKTLKNKYLIATVVFLVWMIFFDHNNLIVHYELRSELNDLNKSKTYYQEQIDKTKKEVELMKANPKWMEKVAREQYLMKRDNEDFYLIKEK